jgi:hyperosmotically inducible periplasmic protein
MRNKALIVSRWPIALAILLPMAAFIAGCKSTPANDAPNAATATTVEPLPAGTGDMSDAAIAARVKSALAADPELRPLPVSVATFRGAVQLSGYVASAAQADRAVAIAHSVKGVRSVINELQRGQ